MLLVGSGLLIRTALALDAVSPGFEARGLLSARVALPREDYLEDARVVQTLERMVEDTRAVAGVTQAAVVSQVPLGAGMLLNGLIPEGRPFDAEHAIGSQLRLVSPGYFEAMRIPLRAGRGFTDADRRGGQKVIVLSETLARQAWPNQPAIGKQIACCEAGAGGPGTPDYKLVIGVAADVRSGGPAAAIAPEFYLPIAQSPGAGMAWDWVQRTMYVVARTPSDPVMLTGGVAQALRRVDAALPVFDIRTMEERLSASTAASRFNARLLTTLGAIGLLLAAVGIYGVIAYFVSRRTQEIGIRLALGASPPEVRRMVIRQAMKPALAGVALGVGAALVANDLLASQLHGVSPRDPVTIGLVCLAFVLVSLVASWAPARRAAAVEPSSALRRG